MERVGRRRGEEVCLWRFLRWGRREGGRRERVEGEEVRRF